LQLRHRNINNKEGLLAAPHVVNHSLDGLEIALSNIWYKNYRLIAHLRAMEFVTVSEREQHCYLAYLIFSFSALLR
jgi:hypothetical protein